MATTFPTKQLHESPTNPRKIRDATADAELLASVKEHGILSSLLIRPRPKKQGGGWEVVLGARRLEAARAAKLVEVPAELREDLDDEKVRELQIIENGQRADVHPLDEAVSYQVLVDEYRRDADWIAARVHKSTAHVRRRLQLVLLGDAGRKEWLAGRISEDAAYVLSRVPSKLQGKAVERAIEGNTPESWEAADGAKFDVVSGADMRDVVRREMTLPIVDAPFDAADATLVKKAGSCTACPKRTGAQPVLFEDLSSKEDLCTDTHCYRAKCDARWARILIEAKASKAKVLSPAETKKLYPHDTSHRVAYGSEWIDLDDTGADGRKAREVFAGDLPPVAYAQRHDGVPVTLVSRGDYERAAKSYAAKATKASASGAGKASTKGASSASAEKAKEQAKKDREAEKRKEAVRLFAARRVMAAFVAGAERDEVGVEAQVRALVAVEMTIRHDDAFKEIVARRGLSLLDVATEKSIDAFEALTRFAAEAKGPGLWGLLLELWLGRPGIDAESPEYAALARAFGVNVKAIASTAASELERIADEKMVKVPGKASKRVVPQ
jgi:ParB/RepB/Spo0J family partition protein